MRIATLVLLLFLTGCTTTQPESTSIQRPVLLGSMAFPLSPDDLYDEAFTLAFEQGYQVAYSSQEERMLVVELPSASGLLNIGTAWVQRVDLLIRDREAQGVLYIRYYSYDPEKGDIRVVEADRQGAETFLAELKKRLLSVSES